MRETVLAAVVATLLAAQAVAAPPGKEFPNIELTDLSGQSVELKNMLGLATVLNFWATWCGPCRLEMPELAKLASEFGGRGLTVLAVDVDLPPAPQEIGVAGQLAVMKPRIESFLKSSHITLPVFLVDGRTQAELGINQIPLSVLLDREGRMVRVYAGFSGAALQDLRHELTGLLGQAKGRAGK